MAENKKQTAEERAKEIFDTKGMEHVTEVWINEENGHHHLRETRGCKKYTNPARIEQFSSDRRAALEKRKIDIAAMKQAGRLPDSAK